MRFGISSAFAGDYLWSPKLSMLRLFKCLFINTLLPLRVTSSSIVKHGPEVQQAIKLPFS